MSESNGKHRSLTLDQARTLTPAVNPVEAMRRNLQMAVFGSVSEADMLAMANKLKEQAMGGDLKAMKLYFELMLGKDQKPAPPPPTTGIAEALRDLVDEIRVTRARNDDPRMQRELAALKDGEDDE